jgi:hypothetical protein
VEAQGLDEVEHAVDGVALDGGVDALGVQEGGEFAGLLVADATA